MALTIRMQRHGNIHRPFYHIVATDSRNSRNGKFIEKLGYYDPGKSPALIEMNAERMQHWFGVGAVLSDQIANLVQVKKLTLTRNKTALPRKPKTKTK
jgi:small subunit ribosomal protein S16